MSVDRRALDVLLAVLGIEQRELAAQMGYEPVYLSNVFNGFSPPSDGFKQAFGEALADLLLGPSRRAERYPAAPLVQLMKRRAEEAPSKAQFYEDLGVTRNGWNHRRMVSASLVDRICCALGVHPSSVYPEFGRLEEAS